jgi:hypothetical protein
MVFYQGLIQWARTVAEYIRFWYGRGRYVWEGCQNGEGGLLHACEHDLCMSVVHVDIRSECESDYGCKGWRLENDNVSSTHHAITFAVLPLW